MNVRFKVEKQSLKSMIDTAWLHGLVGYRANKQLIERIMADCEQDYTPGRDFSAMMPSN